jgi:CheY-like chemotaxis protein
LRTPLTPVIARLALLRRDPSLGAAAKSGLEMIRRNVELEARLIDDLLDITRLSRGQLKLDVTAVDAHQALRDALEIYDHEIQRRHQQVELDLSAAHHRVRADAVRLQQVFWNLIGNSVKYTPDGGVIRLRSSNPPIGTDGNGSAAGLQCWLRVEITDTGIGIPPELMPRIFDPFEQGEQTLTRRYGGLGLGLSISRTLVQMHGGTLTAASAGKGKGATFTIELPAIVAPADATTPPAAERGPEPMPAATATATAPIALRPSAQRILLVDDNEDTLRVMARLLRLGGHQVVTADSMEAALHAAGQPFDLLITDIGLPDGTGWDLMRTLCQRGPVRAIAISGFSMEDDVSRSKDAGFLQHLSKPVNPEELEQAIRRAVARGV